MGVIDFPGTKGYSRNLWDTEWNNWSPHLGFAYQLRPNLVARGGFAITYLPSNTGYFSSPNDFGEATWTSGNTGAQTYGANPAWHSHRNDHRCRSSSSRPPARTR